MRLDAQFVFHTLGQLLGFVSLIHLQLEVGTQLFGHSQALWKQICTLGEEVGGTLKDKEIRCLFELREELGKFALPVMTTFEAPMALATSKQTNPIGPV